MRCIIDTVQATTRPGSTLRRFRIKPLRYQTCLSLLILLQCLAYVDPVARVRPSLHDFQDSPRYREIFPPLGLLVHRGFDLELGVEIMLGRIDGDAPADFAVEVEP